MKCCISNRISRCVVMISDWPESLGDEIYVIAVKDGEPDWAAIERASKFYGPDVEYRIKEDVNNTFCEYCGVNDESPQDHCMD